MQQFVYRAKDPTGQTIRAEIEAANVADAAKLLNSKNLFPLTIEPLKRGLLSEDFSNNLRRVTVKDRVLFTRQLATLIKAGLPLARALRLLQAQTSNPKMVRIVQAISNSIEGGNTLSRSLANYPKLFSPIYLSMVEAGETSGNLDDTLMRLAAQEEKSAQIMSKIRGAFTYPVIVLIVLILVASLMLTLVLPQVAKIYDSLKVSLPLTTRILLGISHFVSHFWYIVIILLAGIGYGINLYVKSPTGRSLLDRLKLSMPVFGPLVSKLYMARFTRTLGSLTASGVPVLQALSIVARSANNVHVEQAIDEAAQQVKSGVAMSQPFSNNPLFPPLVGQMMAVGEQTGTMGESLNKVASYYEDEVDQAVATIQTLIEPVTMVILGILVAFLIGAVLLPIYGLVSKIQLS